MRWWAAYGNHTCSKRVAFPEQACAEQLRRRWHTAVELTGHRAMNTPVKISRLGSLAAFQECMRDTRNRVCHPIGTRHFCKHITDSANATMKCVVRIRKQMFKSLLSTP